METQAREVYEAEGFVFPQKAPMYVFKLPIKYLPVFRWARKWLNTEGWEMRFRGSHINPEKAWDARGWTRVDRRWANNVGSIPLDVADEFRVYFYRR